MDDEEEENEQQEPSQEEILQISLHALKGTRSKKNNFTVMVQMGTILATTLLDSGSSSTFVTPECAAKLKAPITTCKKMKVVVADGGELYTEFMYNNCQYTIQGEKFQSNFRILKLKGYDIIGLGLAT